MTYTPGSVLPARTARTPRSLALGCCALLGVALLSGCGSSSTASTTASTTPAGASSASGTSSPAAAGVTVKDAWVKAAPSGMTAIFGTLDNPTDNEITVVSGTSPSASKVELHEVAMVGGAMKMRPKADGFTVPAHGTHVLEPGHDHIMLVGLTRAIKAGDAVTATLTLSGGSTVPISAIGKDYAGGNESYQPSGAAGMSGGMGMSPSGSKTP